MNSTSEYILFLDSDDKLMADAVSRIKEVIDETTVDPRYLNLYLKDALEFVRRTDLTVSDREFARQFLIDEIEEFKGKFELLLTKFYKNEEDILWNRQNTFEMYNFLEKLAKDVEVLRKKLN